MYRPFTWRRMVVYTDTKTHVAVDGLLLQYGCWCAPYLAIWRCIFVPCWPEEPKWKAPVSWRLLSFGIRYIQSPVAYTLVTLLNLTRLVWFGSVLYEVFPMSFLMEQAGGQSFTGKERVGFSPLYFCRKESISAPLSELRIACSVRVSWYGETCWYIGTAGSWSGPNQDPREIPDIPR